MHIRFSTCIGLPVVDDSGEHALGSVSGILINPDTGAIEGFLVSVAGLIGRGNLFCSSLDILRWGTRIYIRGSEALAPPEDRIRLHDLLADPRSLLGQKIRTTSGNLLGRCADIQFDTDRMHVEWIFPKKWFRYGVALPISNVVEVRKEAIIVRDPLQKAKESTTTNVKEAPSIPEMEAKLG